MNVVVFIKNLKIILMCLLSAVRIEYFAQHQFCCCSFASSSPTVAQESPLPPPNTAVDTGRLSLAEVFQITIVIVLNNYFKVRILKSR